MYERNAIVLERYFDKLFGYDDENNLKTNYKNYIDLVNSLEKTNTNTKVTNKKRTADWPFFFYSQNRIEQCT